MNEKERGSTKLKEGGGGDGGGGDEDEAAAMQDAVERALSM